MGCSSSSSAPEPAAQKPAEAVVVSGAGGAGGKGGGKRALSKFQVKLSGKWTDYEMQEDMLLKRAYLVGRPRVQYTFRNERYEYDFQKMTQKNLKSSNDREIRPPRGMKPPKEPLLPTGPMIVITVPPNSAGKTIEVDNPNDTSTKLRVNVPANAKAGQKMAVPLPQKGETASDVAKKQEGMSTGGKVAVGAAVVGAVGVAAVGGALLGDHLAGGDAAVTAAEAVADVAEPAGEAVADVAVVAAEATADAAEDAGEAIADVAVDVADWLGDAAEDVGDFVTDLF